MKKNFVLLLILLIGLACPLCRIEPVMGQAHTIRVPNDYNSIQLAVNAARDGDTILVGAGRYYEGVFVNKSVAIIGESPATTTVYGTVEGYESSSSGNPFYIFANNVVIANLSIRQGDEYHGAIRASSSENMVVKNNVVSEGGYSGTAISIENCVNFTIAGNMIVQGGGRIDIRGSRVGEISENNLTGLQYTIIVFSSSSIKFSGNSISQCDEGIRLTDSPYCTLYQNKVWSTGGDMNGAIGLSKCPGSVLKNNEAANSRVGISINECPGILLRNNSILNCTYNFGAFGYTLEDFAMDIDTSNTVNRMPIYYLTNQNNLLINPSTYPKVGYLALINSKNVTVEGLTLNNNLYGLFLAHTTDSLIRGNAFSYNGDTIYLINQSDRNIISFNQIQLCGTGVRAFYSYDEQIIGNAISGGSNGVWLEQSSDNSIIGNNITGNYQSLHLLSTSNNAIYNNNFVKNALQMGTWGNIGDWNITYPSGGNYWGEYNGPDEYMGISQGQPGSDGIIDNAFVHWDLYPLAAPVQVFEAGIINGNIIYAELFSNSTVTDVHIESSTHTFSFKAFGTLGATGFYRITLPNILVKTVWDNKYSILLNGIPQTFQSWTDTQNTYFYLTHANLAPLWSPTSTENPASNTSPTPSPSIPELGYCAVVVIVILATIVILVSLNRKVNTS